jgi:hypothetical protein
MRLEARRPGRSLWHTPRGSSSLSLIAKGADKEQKFSVCVYVCMHTSERGLLSPCVPFGANILYVSVC